MVMKNMNGILGYAAEAAKLIPLVCLLELEAYSGDET
jgi:hypothetical protein